MKILKLIGITEILIGGVTLAATFTSLVFGANTKSPKVLFFVITAAVISTCLGIGILRLKRIAYLLLIYFSSVIFMSKLLLFLDIIRFNGALATLVPDPIKDGISLTYHAFVFCFLAQKEIQKNFEIQ